MAGTRRQHLHQSSVPSRPRPPTSATLKNALEQDLTTLQNRSRASTTPAPPKDASKSFGQAHFDRWTTAVRRTASAMLDDMSKYLFKASVAFAEVDQAFTVKL